MFFGIAQMSNKKRIQLIECKLEQVLLALKNIDLKQENIMSAITDFATAQGAFNDRMDAAVTDIQGDVDFLNDQIAAMQASAGTLSAEDQATLDTLSLRSSAIADKLAALAAETPPAPPVEPAV